MNDHKITNDINEINSIKWARLALPVPYNGIFPPIFIPEGHDPIDAFSHILKILSDKSNQALIRKRTPLNKSTKILKLKNKN